MKTIPEIRERLLQIGRLLVMEIIHAKLGLEIIELAEATKRRPAVRRAGPRQEFTEGKRQEILEYARNFPDMSYHELSRALNVNTARISETLNPPSP